MVSLNWALGVDILDLVMRQVKPATGNDRGRRYSRLDFTLHRLRAPHSVMTALRSANFSEQDILMVYRLPDLYLMLAESAEWQIGRQWRGSNSASRANTLNVR